MLSKPNSNNKYMFEIRVAVIGYVSVGKTTVINALLGDEFGQVAMNRTIAVVNAFDLSSSGNYNMNEPQDNDQDSKDSHSTTSTQTSGGDNSESSSDSSEEEEDDDSVEMVSNRLTASVTLQETTQDNAAFRNSDQVQERSYSIALDQPLHDMRPDTKLVLVDIPGINEAGTSSKYKDWVNAHWHTFDVVVMVMDARQGVNTDEQHALLNLAKENLEKKKNVPILILSNKVDDPDNEEQLTLLNEARRAVETLFQVDDREKALANLLAKDGSNSNNLFPAVIPMSAMHAFCYRCGSRLDFDEFCQMDADFIDKIGKDSYGRQWRRFGKKKQLEKAFKAVSDPEQRQDGLEASNFEAFATALAVCIGDHDNQASLIEQQIDVALERLQSPAESVNLGHELLSAHKKLAALNKPTDHLAQAFAASYHTLKTAAWAKFQSTFSPEPLAKVVEQLCHYTVALQKLGLTQELDWVANKARELVLEYGIGVLEASRFKNKTMEERCLILRSMLLPTNDPSFYNKYGFLKMHLEAKLVDEERQPRTSSDALPSTCPDCKAQMSQNTYGQGTVYCTPCKKNYIKEGVENCPHCLRNGSGTKILARKKDGKGQNFLQCTTYCSQTFYLLRPRFYAMTVENNKLVPKDKEAYKKVVTIEVPESLEDSEHFGHIFWKCCELNKKMSG